MNSRLASLQMWKKSFSSGQAEFALKTKLGAVRAAQGREKMVTSTENVITQQIGNSLQTVLHSKG